ncbi:MAG: hypothetical protein AB1894_18580 [Chloroflexota bacterium]
MRKLGIDGQRERVLERGIERLGRRQERLRAVSRRFSWLRLGLVLAGGVCIWLAASRLGEAWGWRALAIFVAIFALVAWRHNRVEAWIEKLRLWSEIKAAHLARLRLDWGALPEPVLPGWPRSPLDIDLDLTGPRSLHHLLDTAISRQGSRLLAQWLVQGEPDLAQIAARQRLVEELKPLAHFRDRFALTFRLVSKEKLEGEKMLDWLSEEYPTRRLGWLLLLSTGMVALNLILFWGALLAGWPPVWVVSAGLYLVVYLANGSAFSRFIEAVVDLDRELGKFLPLLRYLENSRLAGCPHLAELLAPLRQGGQRPSVRLWQVKLAAFGAGLRMNPVLGLLLNLLLPWDFAVAYLAGRARLAVGQALPAWLDRLYTLEALASLANFAHLNPAYSFPELASEPPVFQAQGLGHPLIPPAGKVCNDFVVEQTGQIAIITGSNMAGKSTFIKTVGVNLRLAYAGSVVNARCLRLTPFRLHTCIRISDSIADGYSYFYAEVKCLKRLLERLGESGWPLLYLVDEIFRGTNNRERLVGSRAYLRALVGAGGVGLLATHDLELAGLAQESPLVSNYHFRDQVRDGRLVFDYTLRPGPSPTTNALKIMQMEGLPVGEDSSQDL